MNIFIELPNYRKRSASLFCRYIIKMLRADIERLSDNPKVIMRVSLLQSANWISWNGKPSITTKRVCKAIANSLSYKCYKNHYVIQIDSHTKLAGTNTTVDSIARFINYGNDYVRGSYVFSNLFKRYSNKIYKYWRAFLLRSQI